MKEEEYNIILNFEFVLGLMLERRRRRRNIYDIEFLILCFSVKWMKKKSKI
jgi:hypothetical protein